MTAFTLSYRRGSFPQFANFSTRANALTGAYALISQEGYHTFSIEDRGVMVMCHSQIQEHCHAVKVALLSGRMPMRAQ
jgi:hypothetical protein